LWCSVEEEKPNPARTTMPIVARKEKGKEKDQERAKAMHGGREDGGILLRQGGEGGNRAGGKSSTSCREHNFYKGVENEMPVPCTSRQLPIKGEGKEGVGDGI